MTRSKQLTITLICLIAILVLGGLIWRVNSHHNQHTNLLQSAQNAYRSNHVKEAEQMAQQLVDQSAHSKDLKERKQAAEARYLLALSAARQKKMGVAREHFAQLRLQAATLPDKGKLPPEPGWQNLTLEEEAAYQHAVCTAAMGDKKAAEAEYLKFIKTSWSC